MLSVRAFQGALPRGAVDRQRKELFCHVLVEVIGDEGSWSLHICRLVVVRVAVRGAIAEGDMNLAYVPINASLNSSCILRHGQPEVVEEVIPQICSGELMVCIGLTEPRGGSDAASVGLKATKEGKHYVLNGEKTSISMAEQADICLIFARTGSVEEKAHGVSAFLVDLKTPGITRTRFNDIGERSVGRGSIFFDDVCIDEKYLIGDEGKGFVQVMQGFSGRVHVARPGAT